MKVVYRQSKILAYAARKIGFAARRLRLKIGHSTDVALRLKNPKAKDNTG